MSRKDDDQDHSKPSRDHLDLVQRALEANNQESITCELCNDAAWWEANGFSQAERQQICGPRDLNCPGFGGGEDDQ